MDHLDRITIGGWSVPLAAGPQGTRSPRERQNELITRLQVTFGAGVINGITSGMREYQDQAALATYRQMIVNLYRSVGGDASDAARLAQDVQDIVLQAEHDGASHQHPLIGKQLHDSAGHTLTVTAVARDGDRWEIIGTAECPADCAHYRIGLHSSGQQISAWATDLDLELGDIFGWRLS
jgi:hypothetical protein